MTTEPTAQPHVPASQPTAQPQVTAQPHPAAGKLVAALLAGGAVSVALGVYGSVHDPTGEKPYTLFFTDTIQLKVWFATAVVVLAVVQVLLGAAPLRQDPRAAPRAAVARRRAPARRHGRVRAHASRSPTSASGRLGFQSTDTRVLVHSILGCVFYGVFTVKVLAVRMHGLPDRTLPIVGGFVFAVLVGHLAHEQRLVLHVAPAPAIPLF